MTEVSRRTALAVGLVAPALVACGEDSPTTATPTAPGTTAPTTAASSPGGAATKAPAGFASTADIPVGGGAIFPDEGVVVTQPTAGEFKGFRNICTHQGCPVANVTDTINCNCHGSKFSIEDGSAVSGLAKRALGDVELTIDGESISKA